MHLYVDLKEQWWFKVKNFSVLLKVEKVNWQICPTAPIKLKYKPTENISIILYLIYSHKPVLVIWAVKIPNNRLYKRVPLIKSGTNDNNY